MPRERFEEHVIASYTRIPWRYESENFSVQMIFDDGYGPRFFYVVRLLNDGHLDSNCEEWSNGFWILSSYSGYVSAVCDILSVLHWKVFEYIWKFKDWETYYTVNFTQPVLKYDYLPWNKQELRTDCDEELNLTKLGPIFAELVQKLLDENNEVISIFVKIASFYTKWLMNVELDAEISFIDFVRTIEVYNISYPPSGGIEDIFDWKLKLLWDEISWDNELKNIFIEYHWSTKKFVATILKFIPEDSDFWGTTESKWEAFWFQKIENIVKTLSKTYAVRSEYIHKWVTIWPFVLPNKDWLNELTWSEPTYTSSLKSQVTLSLLGLERIVRRVLLEHIRTNGILT